MMDGEVVLVTTVNCIHHFEWAMGRIMNCISCPTGRHIGRIFYREGPKIDQTCSAIICDIYNNGQELTETCKVWPPPGPWSDGHNVATSLPTGLQFTIQKKKISVQSTPCRGSIDDIFGKFENQIENKSGKDQQNLCK